MKKIYIITAFLMVSFSYGQLSENFDASTNLPAGWTAFRGTNGLGTARDWKISSEHNFSAPNAATVIFEDVTGGLAEDWLVTPLIDLTNRTASSLSFYGGQHYAADYGSVYKVKVSTISQTNHASFTDVATYGEADFSTAAITSFKTIDLSAYNGQQIYIAFVMIQDDGDNWYIDNVNVTGTLGTADFNGNFKASLYPNPTNGILNVDTDEAIEKIEVFGILGNLLNTEINTKTVDLTGFPNGFYLVKIKTVAGNVVIKKVMKN
jgi:hypothetical protein